jgi:hypothetical protein
VAGWYQDPDDPTGVRHWTGRGWTSRRRPRPGWYVVPIDLDADPSWENPGGVDRTLVQHQFLDDPDGSEANAAHPAGRADESDQPGEEPDLDDAIDRPLRAERSSHERAFRTEPFTAGPPSAWYSAAAFGREPMRWGSDAAPQRRALGGQAPGRPIRFTSSARHRPTPGGWRQTRVPLLVIAGVTVFAVLALLINLGTGARAHFSAVTVDTTFVDQARTACASINAGQSPDGSSPAFTQTPTAATPAKVASLLSTLRQVPVTPSAAPAVSTWLGEWQRYIGDEETLGQDRLDHHQAGARSASSAALAAASEADIFAEDNGLGACTLESSPASGLEQIP